MGKGAILIGAVLIIFGIFLAYKTISSTETPNWLLIHISVMILIGVGMIVFFKEESKIEQRKDIKTRKK